MSAVGCGDVLVTEEAFRVNEIDVLVGFHACSDDLLCRLLLCGLCLLSLEAEIAHLTTLRLEEYHRNSRMGSAHYIDKLVEVCIYDVGKRI